MTHESVADPAHIRWACFEGGSKDGLFSPAFGPPPDEWYVIPTRESYRPTGRTREHPPFGPAHVYALETIDADEEA